MRRSAQPDKLAVETAAFQMLRRHEQIAEDDQADDAEPRRAEGKCHRLGEGDDDARGSPDAEECTQQWHEEGRHQDDRKGNWHCAPSRTLIILAAINEAARQAMACENDQRTNEKPDAQSQPLPCGHTGERDIGPVRQAQQPAGRNKASQTNGRTQERVIDRVSPAEAQCPKDLGQLLCGSGSVWQVRDRRVEFR
jgi:hypothetical protein